MDKSLRNKKIIVCDLFYIVFGTLFIWGTLGMNDLNFDKMVFNPQNKFAFTMACYGMLPHYSMQLFCYTMLMVVYRPLDEAFDIAESLFSFFHIFRENKFFHTVLAILYKVMFLAFIYGAYMGSNDFLNFLLYNAFGANIQDMLINAGVNSIIAVIAWAAVRIALILCVYFLLKFLSKNHRKEFEFVAVAGLLMFYSSDIINILKEHFHRIRFREMVAYSNGITGVDGAVHSLHDVVFTRDMIDRTDFHWFTHWYQIGQDDGVVWHDPRSFPSGHTSASSYTFLLVPLFLRNKDLSKFWIPASVFGIGYVGAMGLSRMMRGAHYMTDVTGAALIMFTVMLIFIGVLDLFQMRSDKRLKTR